MDFRITFYHLYIFNNTCHCIYEKKVLIYLFEKFKCSYFIYTDDRTFESIVQNSKEGERLIKNYKGIDSYHVKYNEEAANRGQSRSIWRDRGGITENTVTRGRPGSEWTMQGNEDCGKQGYGITEKNSEASKQDVDHGGKDELTETLGLQQIDKDSDWGVNTTDTAVQKGKGSCGSDFGGTGKRSEIKIPGSQEYAGNILLHSNTKVLNRQNAAEDTFGDGYSMHGRIVRKLFEHQDVQNENEERQTLGSAKEKYLKEERHQADSENAENMEKDRERKADIAEFEVDNLQAVLMEGRREGQIIGDQTSAQPEPVVMRSQSGVISPIVYQRSAQSPWAQSGYTTCMTHQV